MSRQSRTMSRLLATMALVARGTLRVTTLLVALSAAIVAAVVLATAVLALLAARGKVPAMALPAKLKQLTNNKQEK